MMKTRIIVGLVIVVVALAGGSAQAQSGRLLAANVPFKFYFNDRAFPAGHYTMEPIRAGGSEALRIRSADGHITAIAPVRLSRSRANQVESTLVFNRVGDQYLLSQAPGLEEGDVYTLPKSHVEDEMANRIDAGRQAVSATSKKIK